MSKRVVLIVVIIIGLAAIAVPMFLAVYLARREAFDNESKRAMGIAREVLARAERAADQIDAGLKELSALDSSDHCSPELLQAMRRIDITSGYIQAVGHITGNRLDCSSLGMDAGNWDLGPVDVTQPSGARVRTEVRLDLTNGESFMVVERGGFAALVNKEVIVDIRSYTNEISIATLSTVRPTITVSRGYIAKHWITSVPEAGQSVTFADSSHMVAVARSGHYQIGAIAALPIDGVIERTRSNAMVIIPVGILASGILMVALIWLARLQLALPAVIKTALRRGEFYLAYQPIVDLRTGAWIGAEALLRWRRPSGEMVRSDLFIPAAEDAGLIQKVTKCVVEIISQETGELFGRHPGFHIGINLSASDLRDNYTVAMIRELFHVTGARDGNLMLEVTERGFADPTVAGPTLRKLRELGARIAIDDFGTGYSSLSYLERYALDYLKIDKSFVDTIGSDAVTSHVVLHIIEMAKTLKLAMIAEGVETEDQAQFLREHGVEYAQGWLYAKAMPCSELRSRLDRQLEAV